MSDLPHTRVACSCGFEFNLDSPEEDQHYVWSLRSDGTRSMLGECPITQGSVEAAKAKLSRNGHTWFRGVDAEGNRLPIFQVPDHLK